MTTITLSKHLQEYYQRAQQAIEKDNFDYAIELLMQVVQEEPLHAEARKLLRYAERSKIEESPLSVLSIIWLKINSLVPLIIALVYETTKNYEKALAFYEETLRSFPNDTSILIKIATISEKQNWLDVAVYAYEDLVEAKPENLAYLKKTGYLYKQLHNIDKAKFYFNRVLAISPNEQDIKKDLKDLDALTTIRTGNWDDNQSYRTKIRSEETTQQVTPRVESTAPPPPDISQTIEQLQAHHEQDPTNESTLRELTNAYKKIEHVDDALGCAKKLLELSPQSTEYLDLYNELADLYYITQKNSITKALSFDPDSETQKEKLRTLDQERTQSKIFIFEKKVASYPNDLAFRYELGSLYFLDAQYDKAIGQFQLSVKDPARYVTSLNKLGLCFHKKGMNDLAVVQFRKALERETSMNEIAKDIIYNLGCTLENMGDTEEAFNEFKKIYEIDISYRDISQKIDTYYKNKKQT